MTRGQEDLRTWTAAIAALASAVNGQTPLGPLLDLVAQTACRLLGYESCGVLLADPERTALRIRGSSGLAAEYVQRVNEHAPLLLTGTGPLTDSPSRRAFTAARPVVIPDISADAGFGPWGPAALEQGFGFRYSINSPYHLTEQLRIPTCDGAIEPKNAKGTGPYDPRNESTSENGAYDMTRAMAMSVNTYFVQLQEKVGLCRPNRLVTRMGIKHAETLDPLAEVGSWTLGAQDVSPLDMAKGYATFAARGIACQERPIVGVELRDGKRIDGPAADCARVLEPEVADAVNHLLQNVVRNGTGTPAAIGRPQAGKTGTSESFTAWFVGYTPDLAAAVSIWDPRGRERRYDLADVKIGGQVWERVQGRQIPAPIWGAAMKAALKGVAPTPFKVVEGRFFDGTQGRGDFKAPRVPKPERPAVETPTRPDPPKPQQPKPPKPDPCEGPKCPKPANPKPPKPPKPPEHCEGRREVGSDHVQPAGTGDLPRNADCPRMPAPDRTRILPLQRPLALGMAKQQPAEVAQLGTLAVRPGVERIIVARRRPHRGAFEVQPQVAPAFR